ncbi:MAG: hypothetical protein U0841_34255, partial [Chloroflexia bacterium]
MITMRLFAILALALGLLGGILGVSLFAGVSTSRTAAAVTATVAAIPPTATPPHPTIQESDDRVVVDFGQCAPRTFRAWVDFGS